MFTIQTDKTLMERMALAEAVLQRQATNWLVDMAMWIKDDLQRRVPVKTGALKSSIRYELSKTGEGGTATFHSVFYGPYVDEGTKPFTITVSKGQAMRFTVGSEEVFAMTVKNPGIKARNFTLDTFEAAEAEADRQAEQIATNVFRAVVG